MNFQGFSPDSFEQFIRALALKIIGPGVTLFGNGPDGGREAMFQGTVNFPFPPNDIWSGYGVIQAKFKEKTEDTKTDQTWAAKQLNDELTLWKSTTKRFPKPDYYIFCTNVDLTASPKGGKAKCEKLLEEYKKTSTLKGYAIWDSNQLKGFIDGNAEIRERFSCFLTTGDLISEFSKLLRRVPKPDAILGAYLCTEILADEDARLSQAGDRSEDRIRLANVFLDLPVGLSPASEPPEEDSQNLRPGSLHELLRAGAHKLDPLTLYEQRELPKQGGRESERVYGRFVLIGGPGSGKSTIGQFLAQIHRAALLSRRAHYRLEEKVHKVVNSIKARCEEESASWPATPRYPFRVELNAFAKALAANVADGGVRTLSEYLRKRLTRDFAMTHEDLRDWLAGFPWLLIFDGLDEVPSSSNRREVITAIQNFLNEARDVEADLLIVSSSRPDGYAGEFDGDEVAQRYLLPLSKPRALACAQRLVTAKTATKGNERATAAMATLKSAIDNPLIAKLMRSPLQVTFMVTVVAASGKPSDSRWQLFSDYYRTIYDRELHKAVPPFDKVLNERRQDIDSLHHRVGFILQYRAESSGGTQPDLSSEEFGQVVTACLKENGLSPADLATQTELILEAARLRLVFLTSRTAGRLSFDIRSLQEYMAAACLTNADSSEVITRLEVIAHSAYWRNTFLFAVGRFFSESQLRNHREKIRTLCEDLNRNDAFRAAAKLGSRLALEILESGTIGNVPLFNRSLADCALELLANPPADDEDVFWRLSQVYDSSMEEEFRTAIGLWLGQKEPPLTLSAWMLVLALEKRGIEWAKQTAQGRWPKATKNAWDVLRTWLPYFSSRYGRFTGFDELDLDRLRILITQLPPESLSSEQSVLALFYMQKNPAWLPPLARLLGSSGSLYWWTLAWLWGTQFSGNNDQRRFFDVRVVIDSAAPVLTIRLNTLFPNNVEPFGHLKDVIREDNAHAQWQAIIQLTRWYSNPNPEEFMSLLEELGRYYQRERIEFWREVLPWLVACCLDNISELSIQQRNAELQEKIDLWRANERLWQENGITLEELLRPPIEGSRPIVVAVQRVSFAPAVAEEKARLAFMTLLDRLQHASESEVKNILAEIVTIYASRSNVFSDLDPVVLKSYVLPARRQWRSGDFSFKSEDLMANPEQWVEFYDYFGKMKSLEFSSYLREDNPLKFLLTMFRKDQSRLGLLRLAGFLCAAGGKTSDSDLAISPKQLDDPRYQLAAALVVISHRGLSLSKAHEIAEALSQIVVEDGEPKSLEILLTAIEKHSATTPALEVVLSELAKLIPIDRWDLRARAETLRNNLLQARPSGFNENLFTELKLPFIEA